MSTAKVLQKPQIISIDGSTIRIAHPKIGHYARTQLRAASTAADTAFSFYDNNGFADNDWLIIGEIGRAKTEEVDVNGAVTRGSDITLTNTTKFDHEIDDPVNRIQERAITIYGAATDGGAGTIIESVDAIASPIANGVQIQWDKPYTEYTLISSDTSYAFYYVVFTDGTTTSSASDYVASTGLGANTVYELIRKALSRTNTELDAEANGKLTFDYLIKATDDAQSAITQYTDDQGIPKNWPFEIFTDKTSLSVVQGQVQYALSSLSSTIKYPDSNQAIASLKFATVPLDYVDPSRYDDLMENRKHTQIASTAAVGATTITLDDTNELADSGTIRFRDNTVTYTSKNDSTGVLSGIPASGTGSITTQGEVDDDVWQGIGFGAPEVYTIIDGNIELEIPPHSDHDGKKLKFRGYKQLTALTELTDTTDVTFYNIMVDFICAYIEYAKENRSKGNEYMKDFNKNLAQNAKNSVGEMEDTGTYYEVNQDNVLN